MQKITPFLWFNDNAEEAINFYTTTFKNAKIGHLSRYDEASAKVSGKPVGSVMVGSFEIEGYQFSALNGGPLYSFSPAISFFVGCETIEEADELWPKLSEGGKILMEYMPYPFSPKYGWVEDKFGVSWQIFVGPTTQKISPCLMFVGEQHGKAEEAIGIFESLFADSKTLLMDRYPTGGMDPEGTIRHAAFLLAGQEFKAMDSKAEHQFTFSQAISFVINCDDQTEVDHFWDSLLTGGSAQQCGWLQDRFGITWQVVPRLLGTLMSNTDPVKTARVMTAMLQMVKLDCARLQNAFDQ